MLEKYICLVFKSLILLILLVGRVDLKKKNIICLCSNCGKESICQTENYCYSAAIKHNETYYELKRSCVSGLTFMIPIPEFCDHINLNKNLFLKCCFEDFCNNHTLNELLPASSIVTSNISSIVNKNNTKQTITYFKLVLPFVIGFVILVFLCLILTMPLKCYRNHHRFDYYPWRIIYHARNFLLKLISYCPMYDEDMNDYKHIRHDLEVELTRGLGDPWLANSRIAKQINLEDLISSGTYGQVFRGTWHSHEIAVKVMYPNSEKMGMYEATIYRNCNVRSDYIACFIAVDQIKINGFVQTWLIFEYYPRGSLLDFLIKNQINHKELIKILISICSGLAFLHSEIVGVVQVKPSIAHRDIKTSNVLLKNDGSCCICDLGTALVDKNENFYQAPDKNILSPYIIDSDEYINIPNNTSNTVIEPVGTKRYLSPEMLQSINQYEHFYIAQKGDIYAFALMAWEICRRVTNVPSISSKYEYAYQNEFSDNDSYEYIQDIIVTKQIRPQIPNDWKNDAILNDLITIMNECWDSNPETRPKFTNIRRRINKFNYIL